MKKREKLKEKLNYYGSKKEPFFFVIDFDMTNYDVIPLCELPSDIVYKIDNKLKKQHQKTQLQFEAIKFDQYKNKFDSVKNQILNGNTYLLNLTTQTTVHTKIELKDVYKNADAKFKLYYKDKFVCFSPERFIEIKEDKIFTYPMKGTIDASLKDAKTKILENEKELAEHTMVVDLLRNDLSIVSSNVKVEKFRYIDKINAGKKELLQVSSKISGDLNTNWQNKIGDILTSLLPAGSITGTPKKKTVEIIKNIEEYNREFFTGVFGVFDGESLDSGVMIRFIQKNDDGSLVYKSGGGITCDSDLRSEYEEMIDKVYIP
ncbi:MAG: aminodeoxychorismate synthase component I [Campylobacterota bacterium]|nr:aminodeoxychorismate synthase component I [Campylobacterota bacterium]